MSHSVGTACQTTRSVMSPFCPFLNLPISNSESNICFDQEIIITSDPESGIYLPRDLSLCISITVRII